MTTIVQAHRSLAELAAGAVLQLEAQAIGPTQIANLRRAAQSFGIHRAAAELAGAVAAAAARRLEQAEAKAREATPWWRAFGSPEPVLTVPPAATDIAGALCALWRKSGAETGLAGRLIAEWRTIGTSTLASLIEAAEVSELEGRTDALIDIASRARDAFEALWVRGALEGLPAHDRGLEARCAVLKALANNRLIDLGDVLEAGAVLSPISETRRRLWAEVLHALLVARGDQQRSLLALVKAARALQPPPGPGPSSSAFERHFLPFLDALYQRGVPLTMVLGAVTLPGEFEAWTPPQAFGAWVLRHAKSASSEEGVALANVIRHVRPKTVQLAIVRALATGATPIAALIEATDHLFPAHCVSEEVPVSPSMFELEEAQGADAVRVALLAHPRATRTDLARLERRLRRQPAATRTAIIKLLIERQTAAHAQLRRHVNALAHSNRAQMFAS